MQHDLFSSLDSFLSVPAGSGGLLIRDVTGQYRPAEADEVLLAAQRLLAAQVRGSDLMDSPAVVKEFLRSRLGHLPHEVFAVMHLDSQNRVLDYVEMFRGTVSQTSVYPREVVRDALLRNSSALVLVHNHPSGEARPSRADEHLTQTIKQATALVNLHDLQAIFLSHKPDGIVVAEGIRRPTDELVQLDLRVQQRMERMEGLYCLACTATFLVEQNGAEMSGQGKANACIVQLQ
ncbi:MAG: Mov34/MPN/PAD-1 family protein [Bacteroidetes bacterium]|nr:Mov34/MPN/PAD-1 family protein [Bacteroidota bacterium]